MFPFRAQISEYKLADSNQSGAPDTDLMEQTLCKVHQMSSIRSKKYAFLPVLGATFSFVFFDLKTFPSQLMLFLDGICREPPWQLVVLRFIIPHYAFLWLLHSKVIPGLYKVIAGTQLIIQTHLSVSFLQLNIIMLH